MNLFRIIPAVVVCLVMAGLRPAPIWAQGREIQINLLHSDDYANRSMAVTKKSGIKLKGRNLAYDPVRSIFLIEDVSGRNITLPVAELDKIEFFQMKHDQPSVAQMAPINIIAVLGEEKTLKIPARGFLINTGHLIAKDYTEVKQAPSSPVPPAFPSLPGTQPMWSEPGQGKEVLEVLTIAFEPAKQSFYVRTRKVTYSKGFYGGGGGGPSGHMKGMQ